MSGSNPGSWPDKLVSLCVTLLIGAVAVFIAVKLIEAVWTALLVMLGVGTFLAVAALLLRNRNRGW
ncbi:MAG: hypothetical protein QOH56_2705 [Pseudonocardiales bacterium]|jgi:uncharacterized protein (DUF983 family)|nr:hypothetical protein [Pseudonocardiales bacterium]